jgi:hypothetical protein
VTLKTDPSVQQVLEWVIVQSGNVTNDQEVETAPFVYFSEWSACNPFLWFGATIPNIVAPTYVTTADFQAAVNSFQAVLDSQQNKINVANSIAIAAIVFGVIAFIIAAVVAVFLFVKKPGASAVQQM